MAQPNGRPEGVRPPRRRGRWYNPWAMVRGLMARPKLFLAIAAGLVVLLVPSPLGYNVRAVAAWNLGAAVYLALAFRLMTTCPAAEIRERSASEDETRFVFFGIILLAVASSLASVIGLIGDARAATGTAKTASLALAGLAILASWLVMQVVFTLHYAHDFYRQDETSGSITGGLAFPGDAHPDYWDFFYFTTSIGATSQTSDVAITSKPFRRLVAFQSIVAFVYNTTVVALAINLAASLL